MTRIRDLTGEKFKRLTVIRRVKRPENAKYGTYWLCVCECGKEKVILASSLTGGKSVSCGCFRREIYEKNKVGYGESSLNRLMRQYKKRAKKRGICFEIDRDTFKKITKEDCHYCGDPPSQIIGDKTSDGDYIYNGIDRVDSSKGYEIGNIVSCCGQCNRAKTSFTEIQFSVWIKNVYENWVNKMEV